MARAPFTFMEIILVLATYSYREIVEILCRVVMMIISFFSLFFSES